MLRELLIPAEKLYYSAFSGWNRYHLTGGQYRWINDVQYPEARNLPAGEDFHLRPLRGKFQAAAKGFLTEHILPDGFIHPVDIAAEGRGEGGYVYVYRNLPVKNVQNLKDSIEQRNVAEEPEDAARAVRIVRRIVQDAARFYRCGYAYYGWYAERIYCDREGGQIFYDECSSTAMPEPEHPFPEEDLALLYCDPFRTSYGADLDYFSLAVLLFYVLIGKYPYDGRLMDGVGRATPVEQSAWYHIYRKNCIFIFDPENRVNSVGTFAHEAQFGNRWLRLPEDVRTVFTEIFTAHGADKLTPAPDELLRRCAFFREESVHGDQTDA